MGLFKKDFHIHVHLHNASGANLEELINNKTSQIMATLAELSAKVDELQTKIDAEQQQVQNALTTLNQTVADLQALIVDGGTAEERQAILDKLNSAIADLETTIPDTPPTA